MKASELLADDQNSLALNDRLSIRKGSVGAFLHNARLLMDKNTGAEQRQQLEMDTRELLPALDALGLFEILGIREEALALCIERLRQDTKKPA